MSRGLGWIERRILALLKDNADGRNAISLAIDLYDVRPDENGDYWVDESQSTAVRRALTRLRDRGLAFDRGRFRSGRKSWLDREQAFVYAATSVKERAIRGIGNPFAQAPHLKTAYYQALESER